MPVEVKWRRFSLCQSTQPVLFMQTLKSNQTISSKCNMYGPLTFFMLRIVVKGVVKGVVQGALTVVIFVHTLVAHLVYSYSYSLVSSASCDLHTRTILSHVAPCIKTELSTYTSHTILCFCGCCLLSGPHVPLYPYVPFPSHICVHSVLFSFLSSFVPPYVPCMFHPIVLYIILYNATPSMHPILSLLS